VSPGSGENLPKKTWNLLSKFFKFLGDRNTATLGLFSKKKHLKDLRSHVFFPPFVSIGSGENLPKNSWNLISSSFFFLGPSNYSNNFRPFFKKK
jgi:hypothetical protein